MKFDFYTAKHVVFDFDGVFTDNRVSTNSDGTESVITSKYDSLAVSLLLEVAPEFGIQTFVLSSEVSPVVQMRCKKMGIECFPGVQNKLAFVLEKFGEGVLRNMIFVCNDLNDLRLMNRVGFTFVPSDSPPQVKAIADQISNRLGGHGFVREVIEILLGDRINESSLLSGVGYEI
jgi:YrbI family 3-deoxy-D-manno-octulosonate 8-phosphate phosphatase